MIEVILTGIRAALIADTALTDVIGQRVYSVKAPPSATLPYIVINEPSGGDKNASPVAEIDAIIPVICACDDDATGGPLVAVQLADRVRAVLNNANTLTLTDGWKTYRMQHISVIAYGEVEEQKSYTYAGGTYRMRAYKSS